MILNLAGCPPHPVKFVFKAKSPSEAGILLWCNGLLQPQNQLEFGGAGKIVFRTA